MKWHFSNELARFVNVSLKFQWAEYPVVYVAGKRNNIHKRIAASLLRDSREEIIICKNENHTFRFCTQFAARLMRKEWICARPIIWEPLKSAQREKTGGQPAKRACPRVFSETQAFRSISFTRNARSLFSVRRAAIRRRTQGLSSSSRNFLLSAQKKICEPFCEIRAK